MKVDDKEEVCLLFYLEVLNPHLYGGITIVNVK